MSKQRYINTKIWEDNWFQQLDPTEKLFFIYLLTNPMTNLAGAYELSKGTIGRSTGLESLVVDEIFKRFAIQGKAHYVDGWVVLPNFIKHQNFKSPKIQSGIKNELENVPQAVLPLLNIPYGYGMDTVSHLIKLNIIKSNSENPSNEDKEMNKQIQGIIKKRRELNWSTPFGGAGKEPHHAKHLLDRAKYSDIVSLMVKYEDHRNEPYMPTVNNLGDFESKYPAIKTKLDEVGHERQPL